MTIETPTLKEPSAGKFAVGKTEYQPMHNGDFDASPIVIYTSEDNTISLDVKLENETVWLSQSQMALLFDTDRTSILRHINNVYKIGELERESTCAKIAQVRKEGELQKELVCAKIAHTEKLGRWEGRFHN